MVEPPTSMNGQQLDLPLRLRATHEDGMAVRVLEFTHAEHAPPPFEAGAHVFVETGPGVVHSYSLCNAPGEPEYYELGALNEPSSRGGSAAMQALLPGQVVRTSTPRTAFALDESAPYSILIGGGIGITPLLSMAERLAASWSNSSCSTPHTEIQLAKQLRRFLGQPVHGACSRHGQHQLVPHGWRSYRDLAHLGVFVAQQHGTLRKDGTSKTAFNQLQGWPRNHK